MKAVSSTVLYTTIIFFFSYEAFLKNRVQFVVDTTTGETRSAAGSASATTSERSMLRNANINAGGAGGGDGGGGEVGEKLNKIETAIAEMMKQMKMQQQQQQEQSAAGSSNQPPQQPIIAQPPPPPAPAAAEATTSSGNNINADAYYELCQKKLDDLERVWDLRREGRQAATQKHGGKPARGDMLGVFDLFEPEAVCLDDERFGSGMKKEKFGQGRYKSFGDGPKFICGVDRLVEKASSTKSNANANKNNKNCLIYSVGSNNEIDFEMSVQEMMGKGNCELHTFDPTVDPKIFIGHEYTNFHDWGFGEDGVEVKVDIDQVRRKGHFEFTQMSLATAMEKLGHVGSGKKRGGGGNQGRKIDILKIDCEGCEFTALTQAFNAIADGKIKIDQVQVEVHAGKKGFERWPLIKELFDAADRANMRVFHKERNGWGCAGSRCIEYAFASNEFLRMANAYYMCP